LTPDIKPQVVGVSLSESANDGLKETIDMLDEFDFNEFYELLLDEARKAFCLAQERHPDETFYAYGFNYKPWMLIIPAANTNEAHTRRGNLTEAECDNHSLEWFYTRWEPTYWTYYDQEQFHLVNNWLTNHHVPLPVGDDPQRKENWAIFDAACENICFRVLRTLDCEGLFGHGQAREKVFVMPMSPLKRDWYYHDACTLNALPMYEQWRREIELHQLARRVVPHQRFEQKRK
jgi:hypothetical protein